MYDLLSNLIRTFARTLDLGFRIHVVVIVQPFMFYVRVKDDAVTLGVITSHTAGSKHFQKNRMDRPVGVLPNGVTCL